MEIQSLIPWHKKSDADPIMSLHKAMNDLFGDFERNWPAMPRLGGIAGVGTYLPNIDVSEDEKSVEVSAELPGLEDKDITVSLSDSTLTISGEKKEEKEERKKNYYCSERRYGSFKRIVTLPCEVDANKVEASFKQGVLRVSLSKSESAQKNSKTIPITAG